MRIWLGGTQLLGQAMLFVNFLDDRFDISVRSLVSLEQVDIRVILVLVGLLSVPRVIPGSSCSRCSDLMGRGVLSLVHVDSGMMS